LSETVRSFFNTWLSGKKLSTSPATHALYNRSLTKFLGALSFKADRPHSGVTPSDVAVFRDSRLKEDHVSGGSLGLDLRVIRSVFSSARRQGLILHNPAEAIDLPTNKPLERDVFTPAELSALLAVASPEWRTLILCGYYLGGRLSDMASLSWNSVDLAERVISYTQGKTGRKVVVPIHPRLASICVSSAPMAARNTPRSRCSSAHHQRSSNLSTSASACPIASRASEVRSARCKASAFS